MKKIVIIVIALVLCAAIGVVGWLNGWFCSHEWAEADCTNPKTCVKCGHTEGMPEGHIWLAATCLEPRTCEVCGATKDEPKGHDWQDATCISPRMCSRCYLQEGEALGHSWKDATTEAPKTCENCGLTEGERIITDARFTTAAAQELLGEWSCALEMDSTALGVEGGTGGSLGFVYILDFGPAGDLGIGFEVADEEGFLKALAQIYIDAMYQEFADEGVGQEDADAAMMDTYGMNVTDYIHASLEGLSINDILRGVYSAMDVGGVYYVEDGKIYQGMSWDTEMEPSGYTLEGDSLTIDGFSEALGFEAVFTRVTTEE